MGLMLSTSRKTVAMNNNNKLQKHIGVIEKAAKFFLEHFVNKEVIYRTKTQTISIKFQKHNFMHLCGIKYQGGPNSFFEAAISGRLDLNKMKVKTNDNGKPDGTTDLKLSVLTYITDLISNKISITGRVIFSENLSYDKSIRTRKQIFALSLITDEEEGYYVPNSFLNLKTIKEDYPAGEKVINIKSINLLDQTETVYL